MEFKKITLPDREVLVGDNVQYDSKIMAQRGQDYASAYESIAENPEHTITIHIPETE